MDFDELKDTFFDILDKLSDYKFAILIICLFGYIGYQKYNINKLNNTIIANNTKIEKLNIANANNLSVLEQFENDYAELIKLYNNLETKNKTLSENLNAQQKVIYREVINKTPIETITKKKPTLVQKKINIAIDNNINCINAIMKGEVCKN